ncbi:MAG: S8 family serine peptidase [Ilumatobacteraceae bacterium]
MPKIVAIVVLASMISPIVADAKNNDDKGKPPTSTVAARGNSGGSNAGGNSGNSNAGGNSNGNAGTGATTDTAATNSDNGNSGNSNAGGNSGNSNAGGNSANSNAGGNSGNSNAGGNSATSANSNANSGNAGNASAANGNANGRDNAKGTANGNGKAKGKNTEEEEVDGEKVRYIVRFKSNVDPTSTGGSLARGAKGKLNRTFSKVFSGAVMTIPKKALASVAKNPNVLSIEPDTNVALTPSDPVQQLNATWGLDRINQRALPLDGAYSAPTAASGTRSYIIDTGVLGGHADFGGRVASGFDAIGGGNGWGDCNGHGTHVAGTVGGTTYGVAKQTTIVPVRVLDCAGSGTISGVIAGLDWVAGQHVAGTLAVANMSLGGGASTSLDAAVNNLISRGVTVVVAAGNSNADACSYSPARVANAITVGATTSTDSRASYSNFGSCVDVFAPGSSITSAWYTSTTATAVLSGTSMASPHVAGIAAVTLAVNGAQSPSQVAAAIAGAATPDVVTSPGTNSPNLLAYVSTGSTTPVATAPDKPNAPAVLAQRRAISATWSLPDDGGSPLTQQIVRVYQSTKVAKQVTVSGSTTAVQISGLRAGTAYEVTVTAINGVGTGPESDRSAVVTPTNR